jgi:hypothetical protein
VVTGVAKVVSCRTLANCLPKTCHVSHTLLSFTPQSEEYFESPEATLKMVGGVLVEQQHHTCWQTCSPHRFAFFSPAC